MIGGMDLIKLMSFSIRNKDGALELDTRHAPEDIIDLAKELHWKPYDKVDGEQIIH